MAVYKHVSILNAYIGYVDNTNPAVPVIALEKIPFINGFDNSTDVSNIDFEGDNTTERLFSEATLSGTLSSDKFSDLLLAKIYGKPLLGTGGTAVGSLGGISVGAGGSGYTTAPLITVAAAPAGGRTATAVATVAAGAVTAITMTDPGEGYLTAPGITIGGPGTGASATSSLAALPVGIHRRIYMGDNSEFATRYVQITVRAKALEEAAAGSISREMIITVPKATLSPFQPGNLANKAKQTHQFQWSANKTRQDIVGGFLPSVPLDGTTYFIDYSVPV